MADYAEFDAKLMAEIRSGATEFSLLAVRLREASDALATPGRHGDREGWRVIDRRLQALRRKGLLTYERVAGWRLAARGTDEGQP